MKVKILLEEMKVTQNKNIEFEISIQTNENAKAVYERVKGLYIHKGNSKNQLSLSSIRNCNDRIIFALPISELSKIMNYGKLKVSLQLDKDIILLHVYNNLKKSFFICPNNTSFQVNASNSIEKLVEFNRKDSVSIAVFANEILKNEEEDFIIQGRFSPEFKQREVRLKEFFLKNNLTKEVRKLTNLKVNENINEYQVILKLKGNPLYEGNWELFCAGMLNGKSILVKVRNEQERKVVGSYFIYKDQLHYHMCSRNNEHVLVMNIKKNTERMASSKVENVSLDQNKLTIEGSVQFNRMVDMKNQRVELLFIQRDTKKEQSHPISITNNCFKKTIVFEEDEFFEEKGIWDVFISFKVQGIKSKITLNLGSNSDSKADFIIIPKTIYSKSGAIKRIRPYVTQDNNLAVLIRNEGVYCDVIKVDYEASKLVVKGFVSIPDINYVLKDVYLYEESLNLKIKCINKFSKESGGYYFSSSYDWDSFDITKTGEVNLKFMVHVESNGNNIEFKLVSNSDDIKNKSKIMIYPPLNKDTNGYPIQIRPYYTNRNELSISIGNSLQAYCTVIDAKKTHVKFKIQSKIQDDFVLQDAELVLEHSQTKEIIKQRLQSNGQNEYICNMNQAFIGSIKVHEQGRWEVYFSTRVNNKIVRAKLFGKDLEVINKNSTFKSNAIKIEDELYMSIFFDKKNKIMSLETRNIKAYEKSSEKIRFLAAKGIAKIWSKFKKKKVWLIGENLGEVAQDNGFAFFESCIKKNVKEETYYVSKKNNKNIENLLPYKERVVQYDSFKHLVLYYLSEYTIVSHGIRDVIPSIVHNKMASNTKKVIYLQHGIIAMKKLQFNRNSYNGMIKKFVVSSEHEKNIMINEMKFKEKQIMVTGLARFDSLVDKSKDKKTREILLMPTWREWVIGSKEGFLASDFFIHYHGLLQDKKLHDLLEKHDLVLKFFPHIEIQKKYKDEFASLNKRIQIVKLGEESVKELMQNSSLMITDYSSVVFDFNYLKKPTVFYHFDVNDYLKHRGSYVDLRKDLVGDIALTRDEVIKYVRDYAENDFKYKPKYNINSKKYYAYHDKHNFERIYNEIEKLSNKVTTK
ncbi:CDP-glycerol glycerophosphotransferase family protein [Bacillus tropicus]|uniref:CDP-glycerol glycerophosphotransferase family protein n=1 Tax=Bacillus cereus group TaxID=86661 RepID=UPI000944E2AE|nr:MULTISPECIES: CDP-glycerol glycerophosphotransferase family protein [Bacillus cereus group]MDA1550482.1 CDP-glycerol glycerophosphotransferase family protein [Bacillus cereus group sp. TH243-3LC]UOK46286.1 CDP-glycerol glycerophosphotransferase family protein [Bacillus tropicus]